MRMGCYELLDKIAAGGMGTVYRGRHHATSQIVAIKVLAEVPSHDPILLRRFEREYEIARRLSHPNVVRPLDCGVQDEQHYLVMDYVDGPSLGRRIRLEGPLSPTLAVEMGIQIAEALQCAHDNRLIHRDVKPDNILIGSDGAAKLADLGLIKDLDASILLTRPRAGLGTIGYTAPEQFENASEADHRCDIYSLAATIYYALTGTQPFSGKGALSILKKKLSNDFPPPSRLLPALSEAMDRVICRALDAQPDLRPASCRELATLLKSAVADEEPRRARPTALATPDIATALPPHDRRGAIRHATSMAILCRVPQEPANRGAQIQDVSLTGVCMQLGCQVEPGSHLVLDMSMERELAAQQLHALVRWVRKGSPGKWRIGCEFERPLTPGELDELIRTQIATVVTLR